MNDKSLYNIERFAELISKVSHSTNLILTDDEYRVVNMLCMFYSQFTTPVKNTFYIEFIDDYTNRKIKTGISFCDNICRKDECISIVIVIDVISMLAIIKFDSCKMNTIKSTAESNIIDSLETLQVIFKEAYEEFKLINFNIMYDDGKD